MTLRTIGRAARRVGLWLGRDLVASREDVRSVGVARIAASVRPANEPEPRATCPSSADVSVEVVAQHLDTHLEDIGKPSLDLCGLFSSDHANSEADGEDGPPCPLENETDAVPPREYWSSRCVVLGRPNTSSIGAPCVLPRNDQRHRGPFRQALRVASQGRISAKFVTRPRTRYTLSPETPRRFS
jgi:hypothetical protein